MAKTDLTAQRLRELLHYNPETGVFTWRVRRGRALAGSVAGTPHPAGYCIIYVGNRPHKAHRLAWLYAYGEWPEHDIDHINGVRDANWIANLRDVSRSENMQNLKKARSDSASGFLGVWKMGERWRATIRLDGASRFLGDFLTPEDAHHAYLVAKREIHPACTI